MLVRRIARLFIDCRGTGVESEKDFEEVPPFGILEPTEQYLHSQNPRLNGQALQL